MDKENNFFGFIRDKLDIQILILYILDKLPYEISQARLSELALFDGGFTWFEFADGLASLVQTGQAGEADGKYVITEKGRRNLGYVAQSLPYSVRTKADRLAAQASAQMRRDRQIETGVESARRGECAVSLRLSDGVGEVLSMRLAVPDEKTARGIEERFRKNAETLYQQIAELLLREE